MIKIVFKYRLNYIKYIVIKYRLNYTAMNFIMNLSIKKNKKILKKKVSFI